MKKRILAFLLLFMAAFTVRADAATFAIVLQYLMGNGSGAQTMIGVGYGVVDSVSQKYETRVIYDIAVATDAPGGWKDAIVSAMITDAAVGGYTLTAPNVRWLALEPGDYKDERQVANWNKDATKTNIPATYTNVYTGLYGELQGVNFAGMTQYRLIVFVSKLGTGTQNAALVDNANAANLMELSDTAAAAEHMLDSGWTNLPAWASGIVNLKPMAKSTVTTDDPVYRSFVLYLR